MAAPPLALGPGYLGVRHYAAALGVTLLIVAGVVASHAPPAVRDPQTPLNEFSAARAFGDVLALTALGPRPSPPLGQEPVPAHEQARKWVERRLFELGLDPIVDEGTACTPRGKCGRVRNVVALLDPGGAASQEQAVLLLAHYDSVAAGPGAGDDAAGVASVLEIVRALRHTNSLRRPLLVVIDDGEELGLLGARVLCHGPWARRVAAVLNFEARGNAGQTAMFETSDKSAWLVELYGEAVSRPVASSLIYSLYRALPNDTDLTITKAAGLRGLNFAFADHEWDYHTARDSAENLDPRSVQHMGDQGLAVARALLEQADLPTVDDDAVWFDLFTLRLVVYRALWAKALAVLQALLLAAAVGVFLRRDRTQTGAQVRAMAWGAARVVGAFGLALLVGLLVSKLVIALTGQPRPWRSRPLPTWLALVCATAGGVCAAQQLLDRLWPARRLLAVYAAAAGALLLWTVPSLILAFGVPGASYVFTLPALGGSAALLLAALRTDPAEPATEPKTPAAAWKALLIVLALAIPGLLLWLPILRVLLVMVGANLHPAVTLPVALLLTLVEPMHRLFPSRLRALLPATMLVVALACVTWAARG